MTLCRVTDHAWMDPESSTSTAGPSARSAAASACIARPVGSRTGHLGTDEDDIRHSPSLGITRRLPSIQPDKCPATDGSAGEIRLLSKLWARKGLKLLRIVRR